MLNHTIRGQSLEFATLGIFPFGGLVPNDGGYLDANELLLALVRQLVGAALNLAVRPRFVLRRHHDPRDIHIQLKSEVYFP